MQKANLGNLLGICLPECQGWPRSCLMPIIQQTPIPKDTVLRTPLRILTAAALLLHSVFGCGLHDVCGCEGTTQDRSRWDSAAEGCELECESLDVHHNDAHLEHSQDSDASGCCEHAVPMDFTYETPHRDGCCCQQTPHPDRSAATNCSIACSFVQSTGVIFNFDARFVEFVGQNDRLSHGQLVEASAYGPRYWGAMRGGDSTFLCASLCTWQL